MEEKSKGTHWKQILKASQQDLREAEDMVAVEAPLEIRVGFGPRQRRQRRSLAVTMRTPGHDAELAVGFLFTEGLIGRPDQITEVRHAGPTLYPDARENIIQVELAPEVDFDFDRLSRHFYTSSSCGVCGKTSIELVRTTTCFFSRRGHPVVDLDVLFQLPDAMRAAQSIFEYTGGLHAAGLFDTQGRVQLLREDIGRHNALDKLIGAAVRAGMAPLREHLLLVSGRASFELVQKAVMAGIPVLAAVGAPSSLAVELAEENDMTLIGFLRGGRFNVYSGRSRISGVRNQAAAVR